jgi:plasmid stabilization system protein ParE
LLAEDVIATKKAHAAITKAIAFLSIFPFSCRKVDGPENNALLRELLIPFDSSGYLALFEVDDANTVTVLAIRHQREDDYH